MEEQGKLYNNHEVACILADAFGDTCACNFNGNDEWLPFYCEFRETCCPEPVGVACWEQYLKHIDKVKHKGDAMKPEKVEECLKAISLIETFLEEECGSAGESFWKDKDGKGFRADMGYLLDGLEDFKEYLVERKTNESA